MLDITPDIQDELGDGWIVAQGDSIYIHNEDWIIIVPGAARYIHHEILDIIQSVFEDDENAKIDWRILCAAEIDLDRQTFIPMHGRKPVPFRAESRYYTTSRNISKKLDSLYYDESGGCINISDAFSTGMMYPIYPGRQKTGMVSVALRKNRAETYVYNHDGVVVALAGEHVRGLQAAGFELKLPLLFDENPTVFGFLEGCDITCVVSPCISSGIQVSPDGRKLHADPAGMFWKSEDTAWKVIDKAVSFFDPGHRGCDLPISERIDSTYDHEIRKAVSILRWDGVPEEQIINALENRQGDALDSIHKSCLSQARAILRDLHDHGSVSYVKNRTQALCTRFEHLQEYVGDIDLGRLPELVQLIEEEERKAV